MHIYYITFGKHRKACRRQKKIMCNFVTQRSSLLLFLFSSAKTCQCIFLAPFLCQLCGNQIGVVLYRRTVQILGFYGSNEKNDVSFLCIVVTELAYCCIYYKSSTLWRAKFLLSEGNGIPILTLTSRVTLDQILNRSMPEASSLVKWGCWWSTRFRQLWGSSIVI